MLDLIMKKKKKMVMKMKRVELRRGRCLQLREIVLPFCFFVFLFSFSVFSGNFGGNFQPG